MRHCLLPSSRCSHCGLVEAASTHSLEQTCQLQLRLEFEPDRIIFPKGICFRLDSKQDTSPMVQRLKQFWCRLAASATMEWWRHRWSRQVSASAFVSRVMVAPHHRLAVKRPTVSIALVEYAAIGCSRCLFTTCRCLSSCTFQFAHQAAIDRLAWLLAQA